MGRIIASANLIVLMSFRAGGQVATTPPVFEVASVRLNKSGIRGGSMDFSKGGERFTATNMPLGAFVLLAYNLTVRQLSGPGAFLSEKYDIVAKAEHAVSPEEMLRMLQTLLVERFKLVVRHETKEVAVFALTIGKGGPKLRQSDAPESGGAAFRIPSRAGGIEPRSGHLIFKGESMSDFAWALSRTAGIGDRVVVDNTGLKGNYDFELTFERDSALPPGADAGEPASRRLGPSLFSALQEQLGLKLESTKAPVEFLIIDRVERPSEN
jgi:uncharacterized protein (TIGR03435 family)